MKLKYYLRGLGIGILVTTIIFIIGIRVNKESLFSDEEVIARAKNLGMIMEEDGSKTLDELEKEQEEKKKEDEKKQTSQKNKQKNTAQEKETGENPQEQKKEPDSSAQKQEPQKQKIEQVEVSILPGEYSDTILQKLLDAKLIDDKDAFGRYMNEGDYDNLIQPGTFAVPKGSSYEEIVKILTTKQENR